MALLIGAGGLKTQPGSPADAEKLDLDIQFIEDAPAKNKALQTGDVDFVWQTVDELPISLGGYREAKVDVRAFLQIDWSRGGDACVSSKEVQKVEDIIGRKSAMLMFSPDHTVFEFMITNSRLTPDQVRDARKATQFSPDDFTFGRTLFTEGKVDVACLWEPDVTLALAGRPGSHRLFSTADATELVADVLLVRKDYLDTHLETAEKLARVWFQAVEIAEHNRPAAARLISTVASRFRDELGYEKTLAALEWAKWTTLADNVRFFGLDGTSPAFDRVYNQADGIWINYPQAEIKDRFAPVMLRDDRVVRRMWEARGKPTAAKGESYEARTAQAGSAVFTKPVSINFPSAQQRAQPRSDRRHQPANLAAAGDRARHVDSPRRKHRLHRRSVAEPTPQRAARPGHSRIPRDPRRSTRAHGRPRKRSAQSRRQQRHAGRSRSEQENRRALHSQSESKPVMEIDLMDDEQPGLR